MLLRRLMQAFAVAAGLGVAAGPVAADTVAIDIGGTSINAVLPAGYCQLERGNALDQQMLEVIGNLVAQTQNQLLAMAADCKQLEAWRAGKGLLSNYIQYQVPVAAASARFEGPTGPSIATNCAAMRQQGQSLTESSIEEVHKKIEQAIEGAKMNESRFIGVVGEDETSCHSALMQSMQAQNGESVRQAILLTFTIVRSKLFFVNRYDIFAGPETIEALLKDQKALIADLIAANAS